VRPSAQARRVAAARAGKAAGWEGIVFIDETQRDNPMLQDRLDEYCARAALVGGVFIVGDPDMVKHIKAVLTR
jgi:hypothetical protein